MSAAELKSLPALLRRKQVLQITGWSKDSYAHVVQTVPEFTMQLPGRTERRVKTLQLAALLGVKL